MFEKCTACQGAGFTIDKSKLSWQEIECKVCQGKGTIKKEERKQGEIAYGPIYCSGLSYGVSG